MGKRSTRVSMSFTAEEVDTMHEVCVALMRGSSAGHLVKTRTAELERLKTKAGAMVDRARAKKAAEAGEPE